MAAPRITGPIERPLDKTKLSMAHRDEAIAAAFQSLHQLQTLEPHLAVLGCGVLFWCLCKRTGVDPHDLHTMAGRVMADEFGNKTANDLLQSLRDFITLRIVGQDTTIS